MPWLWQVSEDEGVASCVAAVPNFAVGLCIVIAFGRILPTLRFGIETSTSSDLPTLL